MRAIGEPIQGRTAEEISMADFGPALCLHGSLRHADAAGADPAAKSMVIVEGVARDLDPTLNVWVAAEPVAKEWMESNLLPSAACAKPVEAQKRSAMS